MVLPPHDRTDGRLVERRSFVVSDIRVPTPLWSRDGGGYSERHEPRVAGHSPYADDRCLDGRHLFDIIESTIEREVGEPHTDEFVGYEYDFRAVLTCVRCGRVMQWDGTRTEQHARRVDPAPITAGDLVAQQTDSWFDSWAGRTPAGATRDMSSWLVYRDGVEVGVITWGRGSRGRAFHQARLHDWPEGETVEGKDPAAALRKLLRHAPVVDAGARVGV